MRKLSSLCRKLHRIGLNVVVVKRDVHFWRVFETDGFGYGYHSLPCEGAFFGSVRECEQFLLSLFR